MAFTQGHIAPYYIIVQLYVSGPVGLLHVKH